MRTRDQQAGVGPELRRLAPRGMSVKTGLRAGLDPVELEERGPGEGGLFDLRTDDILPLDPQPAPWRSPGISG